MSEPSEIADTLSALLPTPDSAGAFVLDFPGINGMGVGWRPSLFEELVWLIVTQDEPSDNALAAWTAQTAAEWGQFFHECLGSDPPSCPVRAWTVEQAEAGLLLGVQIRDGTSKLLVEALEARFPNLSFSAVLA